MPGEMIGRFRIDFSSVDEGGVERACWESITCRGLDFLIGRSGHLVIKPLNPSAFGGLEVIRLIRQFSSCTMRPMALGEQTPAPLLHVRFLG